MRTMDAKLRERIDEDLVGLRQDAQEYVAFAQTEFVVASADLLYVHNQYHDNHLDFSAAAGRLPLGHRHEPTRIRIAEQLAHHGLVYRPGEAVQRWPTEYAKALVSTLSLGGTHQVLYTATHAEALAVANNLAREVTKRPYTVNNNLIERDWKEGYAALTVRTVDPDTGGPTPPAVLHEAVTAAGSHGALIIADEAETGFMRTGLPWGFQRWGYTPDIVVLGGAGGGGFPFGAVIAPAEYFSTSAPHRLKNFQPGWDAGHPAICAAGYETLQGVLALHDQIRTSYEVLHKGLGELVEQFGDLIDDHAGVGMLHRLKFHENADAARFVHDARVSGLILTPTLGRSIILTPPLVASERELRRGLDIMAGVCMDWAD